MGRFTDEFKLFWPDASPSAIEARLSVLEACLVTEMDGYLLSPVSKLPSKIGELVILGTYRVVELSDSAIREMSQRRVVSSCLLVRGAFETACLVYEVVRRADGAVELNDPGGVADLREFVDRTLFGSKSKDHALFEQFAAINVLTHIQKLSKKLDVPFSGFYDGLSEYCHPNAHGMIGLYTTRHHAAVTNFTQRNESAERQALSWCLAALNTALDLVDDGAKRWDSVADPLAGLAEEEVYRAGAWPSDTPYPVTREMRVWLRAEAARMLAERSDGGP